MIKTVINYINLASALFLVCIAISHNFEIYKIAHCTFFVSYIIEMVVERKWNNFRWDRKTIYYAGMLLFFLLPLLYYPFDTTEYFKILIEKRYPLLGFGIVGLFGLNDKYKLNYFFNAIIIASVLSTLYLIVFKVGCADFIFDPKRGGLFAENRKVFVNSHMVFNFYLNLSLIGIWYMLSRFWHQMKKVSRCLYIGVMAFIFFILFLSEGRSGFLAGILLMCAFLFFETWRWKKIFGFVFAFMIPFVFIVIASGHRRMSGEELRNEPRRFLWKAAVETIESSSLLGNGISRAQEKYDIFRSKLEPPSYKQYWHEEKKVRFIDSHNQYLQTFMEFGVLGIVPLLFLLVFPFFVVDKERRLLAIFMLFLCIYQSVFDVFVTGGFCFLFCVVTLLLMEIKDRASPR